MVDDKCLDSFSEVSNVLLHQNPVTKFQERKPESIHIVKTWNPKQPFINGCFNWVIPNLYIENGCFTKHPFINGCLGFQEIIKKNRLHIPQDSSWSSWHYVDCIIMHHLWIPMDLWAHGRIHVHLIGETRWHFHGFFDPPRIWSIARAGPLHRKMPSIKSAHVISPWPPRLEKPRFSPVKSRFVYLGFRTS